MLLLDTNVVSELRKKTNADLNVVAWSQEQPATQLFISVITVRELEYGVLLAARMDARKAGVLRNWLETTLERFETRTIGIDTEIARRCASLHVPDPKPERDSWIAATALAHDLTVITRNVRDFEGTGVKLLNPWTSR